MDSNAWAIQVLWFGLISNGFPRELLKYQNNFTDFLMLLITFIFSANCLLEVLLWCALDHILFSVWVGVTSRWEGSLMAQPQGVHLCLWDKQTLGLKTRLGLHRWDKKQGKGHICHQLDANIQMFSRLFFFRMINKHVGGMKEKSAHFQTSLSTSHTFPQSGSDVRCPTPSSHKNTSKLIWKWRQ